MFNSFPQKFNLIAHAGLLSEDLDSDYIKTQRGERLISRLLMGSLVSPSYYLTDINGDKVRLCMMKFKKLNLFRREYSSYFRIYL